jgi:urea transporter
MRASIASIIRGLFAALAISATLAALFALVGLPEMAVPFLLATMVELGLIVVSVVWRALTRALPDSD